MDGLPSRGVRARTRRLYGRARRRRKGSSDGGDGVDPRSRHLSPRREGHRRKQAGSSAEGSRGVRARLGGSSVAAAQAQLAGLLAKVEPSAWAAEIEPIFAEVAATTAAQQRAFVRLRDVFDRQARAQDQLRAAAVRLGVDVSADLGVRPRDFSDLRLRMSRVMAKAMIDAGGRVSEIGEVYSRIPRVSPA